MLRFFIRTRQIISVPGSAWGRAAARLRLACLHAKQSLAGGTFPGGVLERGRASVRACLIYITVVAACWIIFRISPGYPQICDSRYSLLVTESLLTTGHVSLDQIMPADRPLTYQATRLQADSHVYYAYPLGSSFLSSPFVAWWRLTGISADNPIYAEPLKRDAAWQSRLAAIVAAGCVGCFLWLARMFLNWKWAIGVAGFWAFGSPVWSTMSRGLWSHDWMVWFLGLALVLLVRLDRRTAPAQRWPAFFTGAMLGCCLFCMYFCRPQSLVSAVGILTYLLLFHRQVLVSTCAAFGAWLCALIAWSSSTFGQPQPPSVYSTFRPETEHLLRNASGLLISPSRGVLIFCPMLFLIAWGLIRYRHTLPNRRLLLPALLAIHGHFAALAGFNEWHGGSCYGPRYFSDVLPWVVLLSAQVVQGMLNHRAASAILICGHKKQAIKSIQSWIGKTILLGCVAGSVWIHSRGAISNATWRWNYHMEREPQSAPFDWRHPQFLARR